MMSNLSVDVPVTFTLDVTRTAMRTPTEPSFAPLTDAARDELSDCRNFVSGLATRLLGPAAGTELAHLQRIAQHPSMKHANGGAWMALGVAFGDALCTFIPGLNWAMVTDDFGTHAALRFESSRVEHHSLVRSHHAI